MKQHTNVKVSVIIAVYNAEKYLRECLDSILNQKMQEIEIICVNDGSTDNSTLILDEYKACDSRVRVLTQRNQGAGAARNYGLREARGEYLSFLDADDFFDSEMLACAYRTARVSDADICVFKADLYVNDTEEFKPCPWAFKEQYFPKEKVFTPKEEPYSENIFRMFNGWAWDKIFRKTFIEEHKIEFQNLRTTNDMFFVYMALALAKNVITIDQVLAHQRVSVLTSLSRTREKSWDCFYQALIKLQDELKLQGLYETYKRAFVNWALNFSLWQLNTMKGNAYAETYNLLHTVGWARLDVAKYPERYFFNKEEYLQFLEILTKPLVKGEPVNDR